MSGTLGAKSYLRGGAAGPQADSVPVPPVSFTLDKPWQSFQASEGKSSHMALALVVHHKGGILPHTVTAAKAPSVGPPDLSLHPQPAVA